MSIIKSSSLWDIIQQKVTFGRVNSRGWYEVKCPVCNDHSARGGFVHDGIYTGFSDYNCGAKFKYKEDSGRLSKNAKEILHAFGITQSDLTALKSSLLTPASASPAEITIAEMKKVNLFTPEVALPELSYRIGSDGNDEIQLPLAEYLMNRKIDIEKVDAHFSLDPKYANRVIIPFKRDGKIIYWQARSIVDGVKLRYLNCVAPRDAIIYGYDELFSYSTLPLFVCEGVFDAIVLNGICTLGSSLNEAKLEILRRSKRRIIFVMDQDKTGDQFASTALANGWEITYLSKTGMDANKSVMTYGLPYTIFVLLRNATRDSIKLKLGHLSSRLQGKFK